ncbi:NAD(P)H-binding protein [Streptomyces sp. NPDC059385]|uniref:NAD(P)H-binding protein n=1 Tax=Streptomyces sp. NPDC059385 TaxID=3346817 RepID=UPI0036831E4E
MTVLITGARGNIGRAVLARLHSAGLTVRAASADTSRLTVPDGVEVVPLALDGPGTPEEYEAALRGVRQVFLYPQPAGIHGLVKAAEAAGVEHVVLLSSSSVAGPDAENDPLAGHSLKVERALADSGLTRTFLRPDAFAGNALAWARSIGRSEPVRLAYPDAHIAPIHPEDIADIAVKALTGDFLRGRAVTLTGPESLTFREQLAVLADVIGRPIPVEHITRAEAERQMGAHMPATVVGSLLDLWEAADHRPAAIADTTATLLGRPARTFRQWAEENSAHFAGH